MKPNKYRKKPVVIEAMQLTKDNYLNCVEWVMDGMPEVGSITHDGLRIPIPTLEGTMFACRGDYIIKGIKGEFYPCKADIFEASYEQIED